MSDRELFLAALDLPPADRPRFLAERCSGDPARLQRVERLLTAHAAGSSREPSVDAGPTGAFDPSTLPATAVHEPAGVAGTVVGGRYKLVEEIGEGGMGTVWMAQQMEPVKRLVAVKLIKPGMDSKAVLARFEAERQALALMDHPNIAKVLDAGATEQGRPFFVMELVKGVPVTKFCDDRRLTPRERLELFVPICQAIQHAHQKGVIHRDIKPNNVLIALYDGRPVPKVIDFGVAKAAGQPLTDMTLVTGFGAVVGTPEYMAPEQAEVNQLDIDTRSDVYSLGVLLYELLAGSPPFSRKDLEKAGVLEILRVIRETEPPRPSKKLSTDAALPTIAANRATEPKVLTSLLRSEVDWIVMKAMEKDRSRRYETANGLAMDVQRHLAGEPVLAHPPSTGYRLRKFARRNRGALATVALLGVMLVIATLAVSIYALEQRRLSQEQAELAADRDRFGRDQEQAVTQLTEVRKQNEADLYRALLGKAAAIRIAGQPGYRGQVWAALREAAAIDTPGKDLGAIRSEAVACLGDWVGLDPVPHEQVARASALRLDTKLQAVFDELQSLKPAPRAAATLPDGTGLVVAGNPQVTSVTVRGTDGRVRATGYSPLGGVLALAVSPDGKFLVGGCDEGHVVWSFPSLTPWSVVRGTTTLSVAIDPTSRLFVTANGASRLEVWSLQSNRLETAIQTTVPTWGLNVEFSADGGHVLAVRRDRSQVAAAWRVTGTPEKRHLAGHGGGVPQLAVSPDGKLLASVSKDRRVLLWDAASGQLRHECRGHNSPVQAVAFHPSGAVLATADWGGGVILWNPGTGARLAVTSTVPILSQIWRLRFDPSGKWLVACGVGGLVAWAADVDATPVAVERRVAIPWGKSDNDLRDLAIRPGGAEVCVRTITGSTYAISLRNPAPPRRLNLPARAEFNQLHFDTSGRVLTFATPEGAVGFWDWEEEKIIRVTGGRFANPVVALAPDRRWLATKDPGNQLVIYDLRSDKLVLRFPPEATEIWWMEWHPDGRRVALGLSSGGVVIWDLGQVRAELAGLGVEPGEFTDTRFDSPSFALAPAAPAQPNRETAPAPGEGSPPTARNPATLTLTNETGSFVRLYWINWSNTAVLYRRVPPGQSYAQNTYTGDTWRAIVEQGDEWKAEELTVSSAATTWRIERAKYPPEVAPAPRPTR